MDIINWIKEELFKEPFIKEYFINVEKIEVKMAGEILFEDDYIEEIAYHFETKFGPKVYNDFTEMIQMLHEVRSEGFRIYNYETDAFYREYDQIMKILREMDKEIHQKLLDHYIEHVHDYATGNVQSFVVKEEK